MDFTSTPQPQTQTAPAPIFSQPRITTGYCEGSHHKKPGFSDILRGESELPKSDPACAMQSYGWLMAILAGRCIIYMPIQDDRATYFMEWLTQHSFSFGAYAFNKGNTDHRIFPDSCVQDLETEINRMKKAIHQETGRKATDFIRHKTEYGLLVEELQVTVRQLEAEFVRWMYDARIVSDFYSHLEKATESALVRFGRMMMMKDFLNRLSSYVMWMNCYHAMLAQKQNNIPYQFLEQKPKEEPGSLVEWESKKEVPSLFPQ